MGIQHTVQQGEHLSRIAIRYGFRDYKTIWQHSNNADLRQSRPSPDVLYPGDELFIPEKQQKTESRPTTQRHRFRVPTKTVKLRLVLKDFDHMPLANTACSLKIESTIYKLQSDQDGLIEQEIPATAETGKLTIPDLDMELPVKVGHLDPHEETPGWQGRLINLGYHWGPVGDNDQKQLGYSIQEFQCDHGLKVTGIPDDATQDKLKELHGC